MNTFARPTGTPRADTVPEDDLEIARQPKPDASAESPAHASHGPASEVRWNSGDRRQPYTNQGEEETFGTSAARESAEGDRADRSGRNLDQLDAVKRKP